MTNEYATKVLKRIQYGTTYPVYEALDMAIKSLEKQVPKNPVGATDRNEMWIEGALLCPDCNTYFGEVFDEGYCRKCGRKLIQKRVRVIEVG